MEAALSVMAAEENSGDLRERVARIEGDVHHMTGDMRDMRKVLLRVTDALETLARIDERLGSVLTDQKNYRDTLEALDSDHDLESSKRRDLEKRLDNIEAKWDARWWVVATLMIIAATIGGWVIPQIIKMIFN